MCDPKPGARCSYDTQKELAHARRQLESAIATADRHPGDRNATARVDHARGVLEVKQLAYDSAPRGQRDLIDEIHRADKVGSDTTDLRGRLAAGRTTRAQQKRALAESRGDSVAESDAALDRMLNRLRHPDRSVTRHPNTPRENSIGFLVDEQQHSLPKAQLHARTVLAFAAENRSRLEQPDVYLTAWDHGDTVTLAISRREHAIPRSEGTAIYDGQLGEDIHLSHSA